MGLLLIIPTVAFSIWVIVTSFRSVFRNELDPAWRKRIFILLIIGIACGTWFAFFKQTESAGKEHYAGFPIPTSILRLEQGKWKDVSPPAYIQFLGCIANFIAGIAVGLLPIKIVTFVKQARAVGNEP